MKVEILNKFKMFSIVFTLIFQLGSLSYANDYQDCYNELIPILERLSAQDKEKLLNIFTKASNASIQKMAAILEGVKYNQEIEGKTNWKDGVNPQVANDVEKYLSYIGDQSSKKTLGINDFRSHTKNLNIDQLNQIASNLGYKEHYISNFDKFIYQLRMIGMKGGSRLSSANTNVFHFTLRELKKHLPFRDSLAQDKDAVKKAADFREDKFFKSICDDLYNFIKPLSSELDGKCDTFLKNLSNEAGNGVCSKVALDFFTTNQNNLLNLAEVYVEAQPYAATANAKKGLAISFSRSVINLKCIYDKRQNQYRLNEFKMKLNHGDDKKDFWAIKHNGNNLKIDRSKRDQATDIRNLMGLNSGYLSGSENIISLSYSNHIFPSLSLEGKPVEISEDERRNKTFSLDLNQICETQTGVAPGDSQDIDLPKVSCNMKKSGDDYDYNLDIPSELRKYLNYNFEEDSPVTFKKSSLGDNSDFYEFTIKDEFANNKLSIEGGKIVNQNGKTTLQIPLNDCSLDETADTSSTNTSIKAESSTCSYELIPQNLSQEKAKSCEWQALYQEENEDGETENTFEYEKISFDDEGNLEPLKLKRRQEEYRVKITCLKDLDAEDKRSEDNIDKENSTSYKSILPFESEECMSAEYANENFNFPSGMGQRPQSNIRPPDVKEVSRQDGGF